MEDKQVVGVRNIHEQMNNVDSANRISYFLLLSQLYASIIQFIYFDNKRIDTYVKTAINRLSIRILINNIWNANKTCVAVASATPGSVPLLIISK